MRTVVYLNRWNDLFGLMLTKVDEQQSRRGACLVGNWLILDIPSPVGWAWVPSSRGRSDGAVELLTGADADDVAVKESFYLYSDSLRGRVVKGRFQGLRRPHSPCVTLWHFSRQSRRQTAWRGWSSLEGSSRKIRAAGLRAPGFDPRRRKRPAGLTTAISEHSDRRC
jgi:hypothetical protein